MTGEECAAGCGQPLTKWRRTVDNRPWHPQCVPSGLQLLGAVRPATDLGPVDTITPPEDLL